MGVKPRAHGQGLTFAVLALSAMTFTALQSIVAPALPDLQRELDTSTSGAAWILTCFLLSASVLTPVAGRLGDMFGKRRTLVIALAITELGVLLAALAGSLELVIAGRVIQGAGAGTIPLGIGILRDELPPERLPTAIAMFTALIGAGLGAGIVVAGPTVAAFGVEGVFWLPLAAVGASALGVALFVSESPARPHGRVNWAGAALMAAWLAALLLAVTEGPARGWGDPVVLALFAVAACLVPVWVRNEQRARAPLVDIALMRLPAVWRLNACAFAVGCAFFAALALLPQFVTVPASSFGFGASPTAVGLFLLPLTVAMLAASPLVAVMSRRAGARAPLALGVAISGASYVVLAAAHATEWQLIVAVTGMGAGFGLAFAATAVLLVEAVPREQTGSAGGASLVMRTIGGAVGTQLTATILAATAADDGRLTEGGFVVAFLFPALVCVAALPALRRL